MARWRATAGALLGVIAVACNSGPAGLSAEQLIEAFIGHAQAADRSMHIELRMETRTTGASTMSFVISGTFDVVGSDYAGSYSWRLDGLGDMGVTRYEVVSVGGKAFSRDAFTRAWTPDEFGMQSGMLPGGPDPFASLRAADLEVAAESDIDGLHMLRTVEPARAIMRALTMPGRAFQPDFGTIDASSAAFDVYVDGSGVPAGAQMLLIVSSDLGLGEAMSARMFFEYSVSNWGAPIQIVPPI